jgi:uncharacterized protein
MESIGRYFQGSSQSFFLLGPRGTGKSTWVQQHTQHTQFIDLLSPDTFRAFVAKPERLKEIVDTSHQPQIIVIDEIQKVPELLAVVHQLIEENKNRQFILTGSSSRKLKRSGVDLMAGRAIVKSMHPFMASELGDQFNLKEAMTWGLIPLIWNSPDRGETLRSYLTLYLKEEVQQEGIVRDIGGFSRFLESASFSNGSVLNVAEVARECQVGRKTVEGYFDILEDLLLSFRLPVFSRRAKRILSSHPKFYYFDAGVFRSIRPKGIIDTPAEIDGLTLEGLVAQHLRAWIAYSGCDTQIYFWRTKSGNEVDFIIYGSQHFYALEVKNAIRIHPKDLNGLVAFVEDYPEVKPCLLYRGKERIMCKNILCIPVDDFLRQLTPHDSLPL